MRNMITLIMMIIATFTWANEPRLVKDLKTNLQGDGDSNGQVRLHWQGLSFFNHTENLNGSNIWVTDGTPAGTKLLIDTSDRHTSSSRFWSNDQFVLIYSQPYYYTTDGTLTGTTNVGEFNISQSQLTTTHAFLTRYGDLYVADGTSSEPTILYETDSLDLIGSASEKVFFYDRTRRLLGVSDGTLAGTTTYAPNPSTNRATFVGGDLADGRSLVYVYDFLYPIPRIILARDAQNQWTTIQANLTFGSASETVNGRVFYTGAISNEQTLWSSDGTPSGTHQLLAGANSYSFVSPWRDGYLIYAPNDPETASYAGLYYTDGTPAGTVRMNDVDNVFSNRNYVHGSSLFYYGYTNSIGNIWHVTADERTAVYEGNATIFGISETGICYFLVHDSEAGSQLYRTDGTVNGTQHLADVSEGNATITSGLFLSHGDRILIELDDAIWTSTGTPASTEYLMDGRYMRGLDNGNWAIFSYSNEVFVTDGTATNLQQLPIAQDGNFMQVADQLLYFGNSSEWGTELTVTDGTLAGTQQLGNFSEPRNGDTVFRQVIEHEGQLVGLSIETAPFWSVYHGISSDGSGHNTQTLFQGVDMNEIFSHDGKVWYGSVAEGDSNLYFYENGVSTLVESEFDNTPRQFAAANGQVLFYGGDDTLYGTDGTSAGTTLLGQMHYNVYPVSANNKVFFAGSQTIEQEIWSSDGTVGNTQRIHEGPLFYNYGYPTRPSQELFVIDDAVYFFVANSDYDVSPWTSDGTIAGTRRIKDMTNMLPMTGHPVMAALDGTIYFTMRQSQLWRTDRTEAGTTLIMDLAQLAPTVEIEQIYPMDGYMLFLAKSNSRTQLWRSRGEAANTYMLREFQTITLGRDAAVVGDRLYFVGSESTTGNELWSSDGTGPGTYRVTDLMPGPASSNPEDLTAVGAQLFYTAQHPDYGRELFVLCNTPNTAITAPESVCPGESGLAASVPDAGSTANYAWSITNGNILSHDGARITWEPNGAGDVTLEVTISVADGCHGDGQLVIPMTTVAPAPAGIISGPENVCAYAREVAYETADLGPGVAYTWTVPEGARIISGANTSRITVDFANGIGDVSVTAANACGSSTPSSLTVAHQTLSALADAGPDLITCTGDLQLIANGNHGDGTWSIFQGTGGQFADNRDPQTTFQGAPGQNYVLKWTYTGGACADSFDLLHVSVTQTPEVAIQSGKLLPGTLLNRVQVADAGPDATYQWELEGATVLTGQGTSEITFQRNESIVNIEATVIGAGEGCSNTAGVVVPESATFPISLWRDPNTYRPDRDEDANGRLDLTDYVHFINQATQPQ